MAPTAFSISRTLATARAIQCQSCRGLPFLEADA
jgi:hypothetical protein